MSPNGRSISSCTTSTRSRSSFERAARRADATCRTRSCRSAAASSATRGPPGLRAALGEQAAELLLRLAEVPAPRQLGGDLEADVVRRALVLRARVAEPDDQPVGRRRAAEGAAHRSPRRLLVAGVVAAGVVVAGRLAVALALADDPGLLLDRVELLDLGLQARGEHRGDDRLEVVEQRDAARDARRSRSVTLSPMFSAETSIWIDSGMSVGSASTLTSRVGWSRMPPSLMPGASSLPTQLERDGRLDRLR